MFHLMKMILQFLSLIAKILDGKLMYASSRSTTLTTDLTVMPKFLLKLTPMRKTIIKINQRLKRTRSQKRWKKRKQNQNSETILLNSRKLWKRFSPMQRSIRLLMIFQIVNFQKLTTLPTLMASILPAQYVTKVLVDLAILSLSLRLLSQDLRLSMERMSQSSLLNILWHAIIWMRVVMVDGLSSMDIWLKTDIWLMRLVPHTSVRLKESNVESTLSANQ